MAVARSVACEIDGTDLQSFSAGAMKELRVTLGVAAKASLFCMLDSEIVATWEDRVVL